MSRKTTIALIALAVFLSVGIRLYITQTKEFLCDDEQAHATYVAYVHDVGALPPFAWSKGLDSVVYTYENYQQPEYYLIAAAFFDGTLFSLRMLSVFFFIASLGLLLIYGHRTSALVFALLPGSMIVLSMVSNQTLEFLAATLLAVAMAKESRTGVVLAAFLFCMTRFTGIAVCAGLCLYYGMRKPRMLPFVAIPMLAGIACLALRWNLASVNVMAGNPHVISSVFRSCATMVLGPLSGDTAGMGILIGMPVFLGLAVLALRYLPTVSHPQLVAAAMIVLVWFGFSMTHQFSQGRLVYAAFPFLCVGLQGRATPCLL